MEKYKEMVQKFMEAMNEAEKIAEQFSREYWNDEEIEETEGLAIVAEEIENMLVCHFGACKRILERGLEKM